MEGAPKNIHNLKSFTQPPKNLHKPGLQVCAIFHVCPTNKAPDEEIPKGTAVVATGTKKNKKNK